MNRELRRYFDRHVDEVLRRLPEEIHVILEEIPLHVEDRPSRKIMRDLEVEHPLELCGCFVGLKRELRRGTAPLSYPSLIMVFREAIYELSLDDEGYVDPEKLRKQIRITILHEIAHYLGIDEAELVALGYG